MLDQFDVAILRILQNDNQTPQRDIGEEIGLSPAAVQRRIKRLRELGVIKADVAVLDRSLLGHPLTVVVEVALNDESAPLTQAAKATFLAAPEVQQCYYVTGESDFFLVIVVPDMKSYEEFTQRIFFSNENIKRFRTVVAMDIIKAGLQIPL